MKITSNLYSPNKSHEHDHQTNNNAVININTGSKFKGTTTITLPSVQTKTAPDTTDIMHANIISNKLTNPVEAHNKYNLKNIRPHTNDQKIIPDSGHTLKEKYINSDNKTLNPPLSLSHYTNKEYIEIMNSLTNTWNNKSIFEIHRLIFNPNPTSHLENAEDNRIYSALLNLLGGQTDRPESSGDSFPNPLDDDPDNDGKDKFSEITDEKLIAFILDNATDSVFSCNVISDIFIAHTRPKYRLIVVRAEVFEDAMRQFQIEQYEVTYTNYFPRNCRMFVHIPVYKGGFINRRDNKDRGISN